MSAMRRAQVLALGLALAAPAAAHDVPFPEFPDPNEGCARLRIESVRNECVRKNQRGYDEARYLWDRVSEWTARTCIEFSQKANPSRNEWAYWQFGECVAAYYFARDEPRETPPPFTRD